MIKCFCNDQQTNPQCTKLYLNTRKNNAKLSVLNVIEKNTNTTSAYFFSNKRASKNVYVSSGQNSSQCQTSSFCLAKAIFRNDTLSIVYSCDQQDMAKIKNECNEKTNVYNRVSWRGEKRRSRLPEYCCRSSDFCNMNFSKNLENLNAFKLLKTNSHVLDKPNEINYINYESGQDKLVKLNVHMISLILSIVFVIIVALFSILNVFVRKHIRTSISKETDIVDLNHQSEMFIKKKHNHANSDEKEIWFPLDNINNSHLVETNSPLSPQLTASSCLPSEVTYSGSGSGIPACVMRTVSRDIKLCLPSIGRGRFGDVYVGIWREQKVAVKTCYSSGEEFWANELHILEMTQGHKNILRLITADNFFKSDCLEQWLITEYHEHGSLFDYLQVHSVSIDVALDMCVSISDGLAYFHMPIDACKSKPPLAHCDVKSMNVLVKRNLTCCISDFGLSLVGANDGSVMKRGNQASSPNPEIRTGSKRYMAPEILMHTLNATSPLSSFQKADMYSVSLVIWEIMRRCNYNINKENEIVLNADEYQPPYFEHFTNNNVAKMLMKNDETSLRRIICELKLRPTLKNEWRTHGILNEFCQIVEELWSEEPNERLNSFRLSKTLNRIRLNNCH